MRLALLAALLLGISSCARLPTSYAVTIDGFTPDQTAVVIEACRIWEHSVADPTRLRLFINVDAPCDLGHDDAICIVPTTTTELGRVAPNVERYGVTYHRRREEQPQTVIDPWGSLIMLATDTDALKTTAQHELGHALGLVHTGPGTIMAPIVSEDAATVTQADVDQFLKVHGDE